MKEYDIVSHNYLPQFKNDVENKIKDGWELLGGVAVNSTEFGSIVFYQAITKDTTKKNVERF